MKPKLTIHRRKIKQAFTSTLGRFINWETFLILILVSISISWIPDGLSYFISKFVPQEYLQLFQLGFGFFILVILFVIGSYFAKKQLPEFEFYYDKPDKKKNLIIFLSEIKYKKEEYFQKIKNEVMKLEDMRTLKGSWQMPIEAINYHLPKLENVFVILSSTSKEQFEEFESLVNRLFPDQKINIIPIGLSENIDFENVTQVQDAVRKVYKMIEKEYKGNEKDTIIDITGGQKVVSIVGALQTIINDREFQYVSTSDYSIKSFDIRYIGEDE